MGLATCGFISIDIDPCARRVVSAAWAGVVLFHDVTNVCAEQVQAWRRQFSSAVFVLISAGFPCQDLSAANQGRAGLAGDNSSLFWHFTRTRHLFEVHFHAALILVLGESVQGMPFADLCTISHSLGLSPYAVCASLFGWVRRPRLWWISWTLAEFGGLRIRRGVSLGGSLFLYHVEGEADRGACTAWLGRNSAWCGEAEDRCLPTLRS